MELSPELRLRDLMSKRYLYLGALAAVNPEADPTWINQYRERLEEIDEEITCLTSPS